MKEKDYLTTLEKDLNYLCSTPMRRRYFLASLPFLLNSCATKLTSDRHREGSNVGQETSITVNDEIKMTKEYLPEISKEYPALNDTFTQNYINRIGQNIVNANNLKGKPYQYSFKVVKTKQVNAFALPAGTVFVTAPLIAMASNEAELAGVIGHEIGHIQARHTAERMDKAKKEQNKSVLYGLGGAILGGVAGYALGKATCPKQDKECMERVAKYGAMAGGAGGLLIQKYGFMANSREDEMEADRIGFKTSVKAGYHKNYVGQFFFKLLKLEEKHSKGQSNILKSFADAMSTHPPSKERVSQMKQLASATSSQANPTINTDDFLKVQGIIKRLN